MISRYQCFSIANSHSFVHLRSWLFVSSPLWGYFCAYHLKSVWKSHFEDAAQKELIKNSYIYENIQGHLAMIQGHLYYKETMHTTSYATNPNARMVP